MSRPLGSIDAEIAAIEAQLESAIQAASYTVGGRSKTNVTLDSLTKRLDFLYQQRARSDGSAPMLVRGVPKGLHN